MEVLQTSALPLGYGAPDSTTGPGLRGGPPAPTKNAPWGASGTATFADGLDEKEDGAGNGIRTRDFDLGKVALYH